VQFLAEQGTVEAALRPFPCIPKRSTKNCDCLSKRRAADCKP
jgi:hypothetical protein